MLVDTGPLYAAEDPDDSQHTRFRRERQRLIDQNLQTVVPYPMLLEAYSLVMRKLGLRQAQSFLEEGYKTTLFTNPTAEDYDKAHVRVLRYQDQDISLYDAVIAEISERLEAPVWTFDHHFDVMGVNVWR